MAGPSDAHPTTEAVPSSDIPTVWGQVPPRNKDFTGRDELLADLRQRLADDEMTTLLPHTLQGMGGVGKTQLAVEYAYRYKGDYDVVWWVAADQVPLIRSSLAALAPRLGIDDVPTGRLEDAVRQVLDTLRRGEPYDRWLLVFDNADQPEDLREYLPTDGTGQVIVTSRNHRWSRASAIVEVDVFTREESQTFLKHRVPGIAPADAFRLADELGDLPLALDQAGALQVESGLSVDEYLEQLADEATKLLEESPPAGYTVPVAAAWSLSMAQLQNQMPFAWELLRRFAFFGPEPIPLDLLPLGRFVLGPPLHPDIGSTKERGQATRELGRYALARLDSQRKTLQIHRLIQKLIREEMDPADAASVRHDVHLLLAANDPDEPDDTDNWARYAQILPHVTPSEAETSDDPDVRRLVRNMVRYLFNVGDLQAGDDLARRALDGWNADSYPDDIDVLIMQGQRADLLWAQASYADAGELRNDTLERMRTTLGKDDEDTLVVTNGRGADLRAQGEFAQARDLDERTLERHWSVFGRNEDDARTLNVANNVAVNHMLMGAYAEAYERDARTYESRKVLYERDDHPSVLHSLSAQGRDLREMGEYKQGLEIEEQARNAFEAIAQQHVLPRTHPLVLQQAKDLSVARRKMGRLDEALALAEEVFDLCRTSLGETHPDTLATAMNLGAAKRASGRMSGEAKLLAEADHLLESTFGNYKDVLGPDHPFTHGCAINLATARGLTDRPAEARHLLEEALSGLRARLGEAHHYTLICMASLASALADAGEREQARDTGRSARAGLKALLGEDHPHTLACTANLAADLRALDDAEESETLLQDTMARYDRVLPPDHFDVVAARAGRRVVVSFEPLPL